MSDVIVVGTGVAGLCAALTAAESGLSVTVIERAPEGEHGGNTRYTEAYLRMKSIDEVADDFVDHFADNAGGHVDPSFIHESAGDPENWSPLLRAQSMVDPELLGTLVEHAGPTLRWLEQAGVRFEFLPTAFITTTTTRLLPVGGGLAIVEALTAACKAHGVRFRFESTAERLSTDSWGVDGLWIRSGEGGSQRVPGRAVILACGGFEGNAEMSARYLGPGAINLRPVARGGHWNKGEGIRMALDIGAAPNGDFGSYHAEPIDPRSGIAEPAIFTFPYGILVNMAGERFTDEAPGTVDAHYESVTRRIFAQRDGLAWLILDGGIEDVPNWRRGSRTDRPPVTAQSIAELARAIGVDPLALERTVAGFNAACVEGNYDPLRADGLATQGLVPPKSNWARPIETAPFLAFPVISANVFTFGGLKVDRHARVLDLDGRTIRGLYAAGETMGLYYRTYTGSTSVLRGAVFGRRAALHAASAQ